MDKGKTPQKVDELSAHGLSYSTGMSRYFLEVVSPPPKPPACKEGCYWCCSIETAVTPPEVFSIARRLRQQLSSDEITALLVSIDRVLSDRRAGKSPYCALLKDGRCSVYEQRPIKCQGWNSDDAARCEKVGNSWTEPVTVFMPQVVIADGVYTGILKGLGRVGLSGKSLELMSALKAVLECPDIEERYLYGERVFS